MRPNYIQEIEAAAGARWPFLVALLFTVLLGSAVSL